MVKEGLLEMKDTRTVMDEESRILMGRTDVEEFPLPVAENWNEMIENSRKLAEVIDKHLDFEESFQGIDMRPLRLCPEQRVSLISDMSAIAK